MHKIQKRNLRRNKKTGTFSCFGRNVNNSQRRNCSKRSRDLQTTRCCSRGCNCSKSSPEQFQQRQVTLELSENRETKLLPLHPQHNLSNSEIGDPAVESIRTRGSLFSRKQSFTGSDREPRDSRDQVIYRGRNDTNEFPRYRFPEVNAASNHDFNVNAYESLAMKQEYSSNCYCKPKLLDLCCEDNKNANNNSLEKTSFSEDINANDSITNSRLYDNDQRERPSMYPSNGDATRYDNAAEQRQNNANNNNMNFNSHNVRCKYHKL